jgi:hypothetical protein
MSVWLWVTIGVSLFLVCSLFVRLALARVLGMIGRGISELYEAEEWAQAPPARALGDAEDVAVKGRDAERAAERAK